MPLLQELEGTSMGKIKVLYIDEVSRIGGGETWFLNFFDGLQDPDIEPILLCPEGPFAKAVREKDTKVIHHTFHHYDTSTHRFWEYIFFGFYRILDCFYIARIVKHEKISLIHSLNVSGHIICSILKILLRVKVIWHIHLRVNPVLYRFFKSSYTVFVAKNLLEGAVKYSSFDKNTSNVIYNSIDALKYTKLNRDKRLPELIIGFVGRITPQKGLNELLTAASILVKKYPDIKINIYGEEMYQDYLKGKYTEHLKNRIQELNLENTVKLCGFVHPQEQIYASIDCLVLPSYMESCPMVILESWAAGVPVIATNVGGIPELVVEKETGFLIPPKDPQAIAEAVEYVNENPETVRKVVENAGRVVRERFDYRENARQFVKLYYELLNE